MRSSPSLVESDDAVALVRLVTRRLFIAVAALLGFVLLASLAAALTPLPGGVAILILATGGLGGFVSIQRRLKQLTLGDLRLFADSWVYTLLSPLVGAVLALLLYLIFVSGLVQGELFPAFVPDDLPRDAPARTGIGTLFDHHADGYHNYAKILFWSFVAGFSENFVTDIIGHFESARPAAPAPRVDA